jgi:plastocyanin
MTGHASTPLDVAGALRGSRRFKSIADRSTGSVGRKFARAGVYRYACTLHPGMTGKLTVR